MSENPLVLEQPKVGSTGRALCVPVSDVQAGVTSPSSREPTSRRSATSARGAKSMRRYFFDVDPRSLGLYRLVLGALLIVDLWDRLRLVDVLYSHDGVLSSHF